MHPLLRRVATAWKMGPSYYEAYVTSLFRAHFIFFIFTFFSASLHPVFFSYFIFAVPIRKVLWTTLVHDFHIFYSHTDWSLLTSFCDNSGKFCMWNDGLLVD